MGRGFGGIDRRTLLQLAFGNAVADMSPLTRLDAAPGLRLSAQRSYRDVELTVAETSGSDIAVSPDGRFLIISILGQLFHLPSVGGVARQISAGPFFHSDPAISPDGRRLAFARDDLTGATNIHILHLESGELRQITRESSARRPAWSPDSRRVAYLADVAAAWNPEEQPVIPTLIRQVSAVGGTLETIASEPALHRSALYLANGTLVWSTAQRTADGLHWETAVSSVDVAAIAKVGGWADRVSAYNGGLLALSFDPVKTAYGSVYPAGPLVFLKGGAVRTLAHVRGSYAQPAFGIAPQRDEVFLSCGGGISRVRIRDGSSQRVRFSASAKLQVRERPRPRPPALAESGAAASLIVRNARIVDIRTGQISEPSKLLVRNGRIESIGHEAGPSADGIRSLDAAGAYLVPGLIDLDVRLRYAVGAFPAYGVTTIREFGGTRSALEATTKNPGPRLPPRILSAGPFLEGASPRWSGDVTTLPAADIQSAAAAVTHLVADGSVAIRPYATLNWEQQTAVAEEAHRLQVPVIGHATTLERVLKGVIRGYETVEHLGWGERYYGDVAQLLAATGTAWMPTFGIMGGAALLMREQPGRAAHGKLRNWTPPERLTEAVDDNMFAVTTTEELRAYVEEHLGFARQLYSAGGSILIGTASPVQNTFHGVSVHWELELLARAGISPLDLLRATTLGAAQRLGLEAEIGEIATGRRADFLLLSENPLVDIRRISGIRAVIVGGLIFEQ